MKPDPSGEYAPTGYRRAYEAWFASDPTYDFSSGIFPDGDTSNYNKTNSVQIYDEGEYVVVWNEIEAASSGVKANAKQYVDALFANYNQSEGINVTEELTANDVASQWNTNYNTTGYYGWIAAHLGISGLEGNVNSSFAINYTPRVNHTENGNYSLNDSGTTEYAFVAGESVNISGTLMTDWAPAKTNGSFLRGETYDTANANAPVLFIEQVNSTESRVVRLNGTFTIDTLTNAKTGETINSTSLEEQNQQTWEGNTTEQQIQKFIEYRNKSVSINEVNDGSATGGFSFGSIGPFGAGALGLLVLGGLFVAGQLLD
jgi:hypothetical protein